MLSDALFVATISQLKQPRGTILELCRTYPGELHEGMVLPLPLSVALCKLARNVRFLIEDYARNTLPLMEDLVTSLEVDVLAEYRPDHPVSYSQLSNSETGGLQRAFCRFETYRYLFARCSPDLDHRVRQCAPGPSLTPEEQASRFLAQFLDFKVTEINCVRDYLYRRLRGIFRQLEDTAVNTLPAATFVFDQEEDEDVESAEWGSEVWLFCKSGKAHQDTHIEHLMSLGLAYIRRIFRLTGDEQKDLFIRHDDTAVINHMEINFITTAFNCLGRNPARENIALLPKTGPPFEYKVKADAELDIPDA